MKYAILDGVMLALVLFNAALLALSHDWVLFGIWMFLAVIVGMIMASSIRQRHRHRLAMEEMRKEFLRDIDGFWKP